MNFDDTLHDFKFHDMNGTTLRLRKLVNKDYDNREVNKLQIFSDHPLNMELFRQKNRKIFFRQVFIHLYMSNGTHTLWFFIWKKCSFKEVTISPLCKVRDNTLIQTT